MHESVLRVARQMNVPLADAQRLFASRSEHGIVGGRWLVDHVHPSIEGHQLLAEQLLAVLADERIVDPQPGWEENRRLQFAAHHDALDNLYFHQGMQKLKSLQDWSAGRARRMRPAARRAAAVAAPEAEEK
jgi:phospholipase/lecithinase/hemolysin